MTTPNPPPERPEQAGYPTFTIQLQAALRNAIEQGRSVPSINSLVYHNTKATRRVVRFLESGLMLRLDTAQRLIDVLGLSITLRKIGEPATNDPNPFPSQTPLADQLRASLNEAKSQRKLKVISHSVFPSDTGCRISSFLRGKMGLRLDVVERILAALGLYAVVRAMHCEPSNVLA